MTPEEIRARKEELSKKARELRRQLDHIGVDFQHLHLECEHPDKFGTNAMGRDPGGAKCPDCGKSW